MRLENRASIAVLIGLLSSGCAPAPRAIDVVHVRVRSKVPASLHQENVATGTETTVCTSPCEAEVKVAPGDAFYATGPFPRSESFVLDEPFPERLDVAVKPKSERRWTGGWAMIGIGGALQVAGVALSVWGFTDRDYGGGGWINPSIIYGPILGLAGIGTTIGGMVLVTTSGTRIRFRAAKGFGLDF